MNLTGYIIEKYNNMIGAYTCNRLTEEAAKVGINLRIIGAEDTYVLNDGLYNGGEKLGKVDFVINRYKHGIVKEHINKLASRTYNEIGVYDIYVNKFNQVHKLESSEYRIPDYILGTTSLQYSEIAKELGEIYVAKGLESSMGNEIFLISNDDGMRQLKNSFEAGKEVLYEKYIRESHGMDLRVYSIRGEAVACMKRMSKTDFRANVALGASVENVALTSQIKNIAKDIYKKTNLDFVGIDLLFGENCLYFCEINVMPGLEGIETASEKNIAKMIIDTIKGDFIDE